MTEAANDRRIQATASAAQTVFTYDFKIRVAAEIRIEKRAVADDAVTLLVEGGGNDYTLTGLGDAGGGTFVLNSGATLNDIYTAHGQTADARETDYVDDLEAATLNADLDETYRIINRLQRDISRTIRMPMSDSDGVVLGSDMVLPLSVDRASKFLQFDANGKVLLTASASLIVGPGTSTDNAIARFDGTSGALLQDGALSTIDDAGLATFLGSVIAGDPGTEAGGITIDGATFQSSLKVSDLGGTNAAQLIVHRHSTTLPAIIIGSRSKTNDSSHAAVIADDDLLSIYAVGHDGVNGYELAASITFSVDGAVGDGDMPGRIVFNVTPDGSASPVEAMRITQAGNIGIGVTSPLGLLHVGSANSGNENAIILQNTDGVSGAGSKATLYLGATFTALANSTKISSEFVGTPSGDHQQDLAFYAITSGSVQREALRLSAGGTNAQVLVPVGSALLPSLTFSGDTNTGIYHVGADAIGVTLGGTQKMRIEATGVSIGNVGQAKNGLSIKAATDIIIRMGTPAINGGFFAFQGETDAGGLIGLEFRGASFHFESGLVFVPNGSAAAPSLTFGSDADTGIYRVGANSIGMAVAGANVMTISSIGRPTFTSVGAVDADFISATSSAGNTSRMKVQTANAAGALFSSFGSYVGAAIDWRIQGASGFPASSMSFETGSAAARQMMIVHLASTVNFVQVSGGTTGNPITFTASGTDTNIDISFIPKGSGVVKFGTHTGIAAETLSGYITIKDAGGTSRKVGIIS